MLHIKYHRAIQIKIQWDTTSQLLEEPVSRILTTINAGKNIKQ